MCALLLGLVAAKENVFCDSPAASVHPRSLGPFHFQLHDGVVFRLLLRVDLSARRIPLQVTVDHEGEVRQDVDDAEGRDDEYVVLCDSDVGCHESQENSRKNSLPNLTVQFTLSLSIIVRGNDPDVDPCGYDGERVEGASEEDGDDCKEEGEVAHAPVGPVEQGPAESQLLDLCDS